jgi:hypothetical protein
VSGSVFVTQVIDPDDPVLGDALDLVYPLSHWLDRVWGHRERGPQDFREPGRRVISLGWEAGAGKIHCCIRYLRDVWKLARDTYAIPVQ